MAAPRGQLLLAMTGKKLSKEMGGRDALDVDIEGPQYSRDRSRL
jgi:hypothetical protein